MPYIPCVIDNSGSVMGPTGPMGTMGLSAFEIWQMEMPEIRNTMTKAQFLVSLIGATGMNGIDGIDGTNGTNGTNGRMGIQGQSAYQIWLGLGNTGNMAAFIVAITGHNGSKGDTGEMGTMGTMGLMGLSAFQIWKNADPVTRMDMTIEQYLASLVGASGSNGSNGSNGSSGISLTNHNPSSEVTLSRRSDVSSGPFTVWTTLNTIRFTKAERALLVANITLFLDRIHLEPAIKVETEIIDLTNMIRYNFQNLTTQPRPDLPNSSEVRLSMNLLATVETTPDLVLTIRTRFSPPDPDNLVANTAPVAYQYYNVLTFEEGLAGTSTASTTQGQKGDTGAMGLNAYQVWQMIDLANRSELVEQDFIDDITGIDGAMGADGTTGAKGDTGDTGDTGPMGADGDSAYQVWLDQGNTGDMAAFIAALKGATGDTGKMGLPGTSSTESSNTTITRLPNRSTLLVTLPGSNNSWTAWTNIRDVTLTTAGSTTLIANPIGELSSISSAGGNRLWAEYRIVFMRSGQANEVCDQSITFVRNNTNVIASGLSELQLSASIDAKEDDQLVVQVRMLIQSSVLAVTMQYIGSVQNYTLITY